MKRLGKEKKKKMVNDQSIVACAVGREELENLEVSHSTS